MENEELVLIRDAWISHARSSDQQYFWAWENMDAMVRNSPDDAFQLICMVLDVDQSDQVMESLASGPLEDLCAKHGAKLIQKIEATATASPTFATLLGGIWKDDIPADIWKRICAIRNTPW